MELPRITLVTPSLNQGRYIEETILSVLGQNYSNLEYIIMDGGSKDSTKEVIRKYENRLSFWRSAPDAGQSSAIAAGFSRATGEILNWINADDLLKPGALHFMADFAKQHPEAGVLAAATENFRDGEAHSYSLSCPRGLDIESLLGIGESRVERHQPGIFIRRSAYEDIGGVKQDLHFCMDYDLYLRLAAQGVKVAYTAQPVARFRSHDASKTGGLRMNTARTVRELIASADETGRNCNILPNHTVHLNTLCGGAVLAARRGQWREARECAVLAFAVGSPSSILKTYIEAGGRRLARWFGGREVPQRKP
jgi:GT2 family glycosyltransferase